MSPTNFIGAGKIAYALAHYDEALNHFTSAIRHAESTSTRLAALDYRIGAQLKLKHTQHALDDAKAMVRQARDDGRGYLRCGQLESLLGNHESALKWYQHGAKNVPVTDKLHAILQAKVTKAEQAVKRAMINKNARDPMIMLPVEVMQMLINLLEFRTLVGMTRVSKAWKNTLCSMQPLSDTLDFRDASKAVSQVAFRASLRRLKQYPKEATLIDLAESASKLLLEHLQRWIDKDCLEELCIGDRRGGFTIKTTLRLKIVVLGCATPTSFDDARKILERCPRLEIARFASIRNDELMPIFEVFPSSHALKELVLRFKGTARLKIPIGCSFHNLRILSCSNIFTGEDQGFTHLLPQQIHPVDEVDGEQSLAELPLTYLELEDSSVSLSCMPLTLKTLKLVRNRYSGPAIHSSDSGIPSLRSFSYSSKGRSIEWEASNLLLPLLQALGARGCLEHLNLCRGLHGGIILTELPAQPNLEILILLSQELNDDDTDSFVNKFPKLKSLRLRQAAITGVFVGSLLRKEGSKIEYIMLEDCPKVSPDVVEFAKTRGVTVEIKNEYSEDGKKVRQAW